MSTPTAAILSTAAVAFLVGVAATWLTWQAERQDAAKHTFARFEYRSDRVGGQILEQLRNDETMLRTVVGVAAGTASPEQAPWRRYLESIAAEPGQPGREAIAFAPRITETGKPSHEAQVRTQGMARNAMPATGDRDEHFPLAHVRSFDANGSLPVGFDLAADPAAAEAMRRARDSGRPVMSAPLAVPNGTAGDDSKVVLIMPAYAAGRGRDEISDRRAALQGFALVVYSVANSAGRALGPDANLIGLRIADADRSLYTSPQMRRHQAEGFQPKLRRSKAIDVGGRTWTLDFAALPAFQVAAGDDGAIIVLVGGILVSALLSGLVAVTMNTRRAALDIAGARTSELRAALAKAEASEARVRAVVDNAVEGIITIDDEGIIESFNPAAEKIFGYPAAEVVGRNMGMLMAGPHRDNHDGYIVSYLRTGEAKIIGIGREVPGRHRNGSTVPLELSVSEMRVGAKRSFCGIVRDITERKLAEQAILRSEQKLRSYIDQSLDGVFVVDGAGRYLEANPAACSLLGYDESELLRLSIADTFYPDEANLGAGVEHFQRVIDTGRSKGEVSLLHKDGRRVITDINAVALGSGRYLGLLRDVTERRLAERALEQEREHLETRVAERTEVLTRTNEALQQEINERTRIEGELRAARELALRAAEAKAGFLANMSHEIRTPMNAVIGTAALLQDTPLNPEQRSYVDTICTGSDMLLGTINDILDFSKIESGMLKLEVHPFEVGHLVEEAFDLLAPKAADKGIELFYMIADDVPVWVLGDPTRLRQILVNLLSNAVKFTDSGEVCITVRRVDRRSGIAALQFAVRDTGIGMAAGNMEYLFKPFSQADASTTRKYGGTGLGLAICARLVQMVGGEIWAESEEGQGSTFHFTVPAPAVESGAARQYPRETVAALATRRALLVAENPTGIHILEAQFRRWGIDVASASTAADAVAAIDGSPPFDAIIVDGELQDVHSVERAVRCRTDSSHSALIRLSSSTTRQASAQGDAGPFDADLAKPVKHSRLLRALVTAFGAEAPEAPAPEPPYRVDATLGQRLPLRILVAEDTKINQKLAARILAKLGYSCDIAETGAEVLERLAARHYDLILMDLQMPVMDGIEATRRIAAEWPAHMRPYIIAMTAIALPGDRERCLAAGMNDYIAKPVLPASVQRAIERFGTRRGAVAAGAAGSPPVDGRTIDELRALDEPGKPSLLHGLIRDYFAEAPRAIDDIRQCVAARDAATLAARAHRLAGISLSLGASEVAQVCVRIEKQASRGDLQGTENLIAELLSSFGKTRAELSGLL